MSKHTPGPWEPHFEESYFVTGPDLGRVAMMLHLKGAHGLGGRRSDEEAAENCRLIAAAPDLLGALEAMHELFADEHDSHSVRGMVCGRAMLAIKKARGEA